EPAVQEVSDVGAEVSADSSEVIDVDALFIDEDFEQQAKRFRPTGTQTPKSTPKTPHMGKRKSWSGKPSALFSSPKARGSSEGTMSTPPRPPLSEKHWNCESCTYTNNALLPYCEICESPRSKKCSKNEAAFVTSVREEKENQSQSDGDNEPVECAQRESPPSLPSDLKGDHLPNIQNKNLEGHPGENSTATEP
ncbi:unnamed protein product, partial [Staurois parvus]